MRMNESVVTFLHEDFPKKTDFRDKRENTRFVNDGELNE